MEKGLNRPLYTNQSVIRNRKSNYYLYPEFITLFYFYQALFWQHLRLACTEFLSLRSSMIQLRCYRWVSFNCYLNQNLRIQSIHSHIWRYKEFNRAIEIEGAILFTAHYAHGHLHRYKACQIGRRHSQKSTSHHCPGLEDHQSTQSQPHASLLE